MSSAKPLRFPMLHPTVRLVTWGVAAALVQWLPPSGLLLACAAALAAGAWYAQRRLGLLLKRTRWLIVSLVLLFALATPGVYLLPMFGSLSPTEEGLRLGLEHFMRLLFVLASLAVLLEMTGLEGLVVGLHAVVLAGTEPGPGSHAPDAGDALCRGVPAGTSLAGMAAGECDRWGGVQAPLADARLRRR